MKCVAGCELHDECSRCDGEIEIRMLFCNQLELPLCDVHYQEFLEVKLPAEVQEEGEEPRD